MHDGELGERVIYGISYTKIYPGNFVNAAWEHTVDSIASQGLRIINNGAFQKQAMILTFIHFMHNVVYGTFCVIPDYVSFYYVCDFVICQLRR